MYKGVLYDAHNVPTDPHYQLSKVQLETLARQLAGKPIRIEHDDKNLGRVVSASAADGSLICEWDLDDSAKGWAAEHLLSLGKATELSLKHILFNNGDVEPVEVSIVRKGARDGCRISNGQYLASKTIRASAVMSAPTESAAAPVAAEPAAVVNTAAPPVPAPVAPAPVAAAAPAAASDPASDEPSAKRAKLDDPMMFLNSLAQHIADPSTMQTIADYIAAQLEVNVGKEREISALQEAKALLEKAQSAQVESSKNVVRDIVETLASLYEQYGQQKIADPARSKLTNILTSDPEALDAMRPILVAASAIHKSAGAHALAARDDALKSTLAKVGVLQNQLNAVRHIGAPGAPAVTPNWTPAAAPAVVEVAASAAAVAAPAGPTAFRVPDILRGAPKFGDAPGVGRVSSRDFTRAFEK